MIASTNNLRQLADTPIDFIPSDEFTQRDAAKQILAAPPTALPERCVKPGNNEFGAYLGGTCRLPLMTRDEEAYYFRRMNFLKWRAESCRQALARKRPSTSKLQKLAADVARSTQDFHFIAEHNLRLVIPLARKAESHGVTVWDAISEGNTAMLRAIQKFDYSRGFRFSTYATWAIQRSLYRCAEVSHRDRSRFPSVESAHMMECVDNRESQTAEESRHHAATAAVQRLLQQLDDRSQTVLRLRFGLKPDRTPMTLKDVAARVGVSRERIRQIEVAAIQELEKISDLFPVADCLAS